MTIQKESPAECWINQHHPGNKLPRGKRFDERRQLHELNHQQRTEIGKIVLANTRFNLQVVDADD